MRSAIRTATITVAITFVASLALAQSPVTSPTLDIQVPVRPRPFVADGVVHLAYEIHLTNPSATAIRLDAVEIREAAQQEEALLASLEGPLLEEALRRAGAPAASAEIRVLPAGQSTVVFVWATVRSPRIPAAVSHRLRFSVESTAASGRPEIQDPVPGDRSAFTIDGIDVPLASMRPRVIGPPLAGDGWLALNGPHNDAGHRRALITLSGEARIAQRFAIDWVRLFDDGRTFHGHQLDNNSYRSFGANVLAVDDGVVRDMLDGIPENVPHPTDRVIAITPKTLVGNYVVLDIGGDAYAVYAHLQLASVQVKVGDRVRKGQVLGRVGNTGNSSEPHLHFHMVDRPSAIDAEGIPYALESFMLELAPDRVTVSLAGDSVSVDEGTVAARRDAVPQRRQNELPLLNALVTFSGR